MMLTAYKNHMQKEKSPLLDLPSNCNSMHDFVHVLRTRPLETYTSLLLNYQLRGHDFSFPAFRSTINFFKASNSGFSAFLSTIFSYKDPNPIDDIRLIRLIEEVERENYPFSKTAKLIQDLVYYSDEQSRVENNDQITPIDGYSIRKEDAKRGDAGISFKFPCEIKLDTQFFVQTRVVPIYPLGITKPNGPGYDFFSSRQPIAFFNHDRAHASLSGTIDKEVMGTIRKSNQSAVFPIVDRYLLGFYLNNALDALEENNFKKTLGLFLFQAFHENNARGRIIDALDKEIYLSNLESLKIITVEHLNIGPSRSFDYGSPYQEPEVRKEIIELLPAAQKFLNVILEKYTPPLVELELNQFFLSPTLEPVEANIQKIRELEDTVKKALEENLSAANPPTGARICRPS